MRIAIFGKYPPIQGGVSRQIHLTAHQLARRGHEVFVVTNANEVEISCRQLFIHDDNDRLDGMYPPHGSVKVLSTSGMSPSDYIPWAQPFASKLFGLGMEVLSSTDFDVIVGWYLEPYGLVASQLSKVAGIPLVLRHAGSDVGRLIDHPNLRPAYEWSLSNADRVLTDARTQPLLHAMGANKDAIRVIVGSQIPSYFSRTGPVLDLPVLTSTALEVFSSARIGPIPKSVLQQGFENSSILSEPTPIIGTYGKVGRTKGSYDLLDALDTLLESGLEFHFVTLSGGQSHMFDAYLKNLAERSNLRKQTVTLPFIAPWRVPEYLRLCDMVCVLERDFPIEQHRPRVPTEVMAGGTTLVCSGEVADKQTFANSLVDRRNYLRVDDPRDGTSLLKALVFALENDTYCRDVAAHGAALVRTLNKETQPVDAYADAIEQAGVELS